MAGMDLASKTERLVSVHFSIGILTFTTGVGKRS